MKGEAEQRKKKELEGKETQLGMSLGWICWHWGLAATLCPARGQQTRQEVALVAPGTEDLWAAFGAGVAPEFLGVSPPHRGIPTEPLLTASG